MHDLGNLLERLMRAGRCLGVDDAEHFYFGMLRQQICHRSRLDRLAPRRFDGVDGRARALHHILHTAAEDAVHAHACFIAWLQQVHHARLHARAAGAADGHGEFVLRAEDLAQKIAHLVHDFQILGIEMAESRRGERAEDSFRHLARPGAHEDAFWRSEAWCDEGHARDRSAEVCFRNCKEDGLKCREIPKCPVLSSR